MLCADSGREVLLKRYVRRFRVGMRLPANVELKANAMQARYRSDFCRGLADLPCSAHYIVVNKDRVRHELRRDTNILYNYACGLILTPLTQMLKHATLHLDCRTIKVASGNSLPDYLRIKLWYELNSSVSVRFRHMDSRECLGIQAADAVANAVFRKYEYADPAAFGHLVRLLGETKELFF